MKKWQKVTIWVASILIVLVVGGLFAANYAVDKVLNSMVGMSVEDLFEDDVLDTEDIAEIGDELTPSSDSLDASNEQEHEASKDQATEQKSNSNSGGQNTEPAAPSNNDEKQTSLEKPSATTKPEGDKSDSGYTANISVDKAKEVQENITVAEKAKVVTTLMSSLSASDIASLQKLASGGMNTDEKKVAKEILLEKLTEDQYNELVAIAAKHGLSQGRSYSEVKDE